MYFFYEIMNILVGQVLMIILQNIDIPLKKEHSYALVKKIVALIMSFLEKLSNIYKDFSASLFCFQLNPITDPSNVQKKKVD